MPGASKDVKKVLGKLHARVNDMILVKMEEIDNLTSYLNFKQGNGDWHGVADAAMDIRDAESEIKAYQTVITELISMGRDKQPPVNESGEDYANVYKARLRDEHARQRRCEGNCVDVGFTDCIEAVCDLCED